MRGLSEHGYDCVGVEVDEEIAAEARAAGLDVRTLDMRDLRRVEGVFDAVISMWASFGYFDDASNEDVLRQMTEKLRPGGVLVFDLHNRDFYEPRQGPWAVRPGIMEMKSVRDRRLFVEHDDGARFEWRLYEPEELAALTGLEVVEVERSPDVPRMRIVLAR
jgi:SAM-dependent methyltransferase